MTVRTCFLLYYNFCLWNYIKELFFLRASGTSRTPQGDRVSRMRVQRYNISANRQNITTLFLKKYTYQLYNTLYYYCARKSEYLCNRKEKKQQNRLE